jgi:hypothetical protein
VALSAGSSPPAANVACDPQDPDQCRIAMHGAIVVGVALGTLIHGWRGLRETLDPLFAAYYAIPVYAFYPLFIVIFGLGDFPQIADRLHARAGGRDRQHAQRPRPRAARADQDRAHPAPRSGRDRAESHAALRGAVHLHRHQARGRVFVHRRDRRRVDHVAHRPRLRDRLRLQQLRQRRDVSADRVRARARITVNTMFFLWEKKMLARRRA